jgi:hypothetical protein
MTRVRERACTPLPVVAGLHGPMSTTLRTRGHRHSMHRPNGTDHGTCLSRWHGIARGRIVSKAAWYCTRHRHKRGTQAYYSTQNRRSTLGRGEKRMRKSPTFHLDPLPGKRVQPDAILSQGAVHGRSLHDISGKPWQMRFQNVVCYCR